MSKVNNNEKYVNFRKEFPYFIYEKYDYSVKDGNLNITFTFNLADRYFFYPEISIPYRDFYNKDAIFSKDSILTNNSLSNLIFHIGLIELISYWKAACPPEIIIKPHLLTPDQVNWWRKLYFNGLGEFFYLNSIEAKKDNFVNIINSPDKTWSAANIQQSKVKFTDSNIVPIGGGKDSIVTLNLLKDSNKNFRCMIINPRQATLNTVYKAGFSREDIIEVNRSIHPQLLDLNNKGFLNGHTPFSALLAFVSLLTSYMTGYKNIILSNESSANESTVNDSDVNHQYSKSFEFEQDFRNYVNKYVSDEMNYFSLLRPLNELQIAKLFASNTEYFSIFRSCNAGSKTDTWCCKCPKCLFTFIILSPFISIEKLTEIFGMNLFESEDLLEVFNQLIGADVSKPFDCVGTLDEVNTACVLTINKLIKSKNSKYYELPYLLNYHKNSVFYNKYLNLNPESILNQVNNEHNLNSEFLKIILNIIK